jgi:hypothetical protein
MTNDASPIARAKQIAAVRNRVSNEFAIRWIKIMRTFTARRRCGRLSLLLRPDSQKARGTGASCGETSTPPHTLQGRSAFAGFDDGAEPNGSLVVDGAGNIYGTAIDGGAYGYGLVFEITP